VVVIVAVPPLAITAVSAVPGRVVAPLQFNGTDQSPEETPQV
jgi:hypothetical protein